MHHHGGVGGWGWGEHLNGTKEAGCTSPTDSKTGFSHKGLGATVAFGLLENRAVIPLQWHQVAYFSFSDVEVAQIHRTPRSHRKGISNPHN